eukprot:TRINITY_DN32088_c0_g1_i1.p1 TRINITY_DN32088_c0_g1~~TRINITY_DN32088_c0_g1_i1.p1  ORF type:complete len:1110 (+),score=402.15 TRINITY_DN32088_c0_g1_i1:371-3331(+)
MGPAAGLIAAHAGGDNYNITSYKVTQPPTEPYLTLDPTAQFINHSVSYYLGSTVFRFSRYLTNVGGYDINPDSQLFNIAGSKGALSGGHEYAAQVAVELNALPPATCIPSSLVDDTGALYACKQLVKEDAWVHWRLNLDTQSVSFAATESRFAPGWIGLTVAEKQGMMGPAKGVIGYCTSPGSDCAVQAYAVSQPTEGGPYPLKPINESLLSSSMTYEQGAAILRFERKLANDGGNPIDPTKPLHLNLGSDASYPISDHSIEAAFIVDLMKSPAPFCQPSTLTLSDTDSTTYLCSQGVDAGVTVHWRLDRWTGELSMAVEAPAKGWTGLVVAKTSGMMAPSYGSIGSCNGTTCDADAYNVTNPYDGYPLTVSTAQKFINQTYTQSNGMATLRFARMMSGAGGLDLSADGMSPFNFAMGAVSDGVLQGHSGSDAETLLLPLGAYPTEAVYCTQSTMAFVEGLTYTCVSDLGTNPPASVHWRYDAEEKAVAFAVTVPLAQLGWMGLTFAQEWQKMGPAEGPIGSCSSDTSCSVDVYNVAFPVPDEYPLNTSKLVLVNQSVVFADGIATMQFARKLSGLSSSIQVFSPTIMNFAASESYPIEGHSVDTSFQITVGAVPSQATPAPPVPPTPAPGCTPSDVLLDKDTLYECMVTLDSSAGVVLHWRLDATAGVASLGLTSKAAPGWLALTVAEKAGFMGPAKGVIGQFTDGKYSVGTYIVNTDSSDPAIKEDDAQKLMNSSFAYENGVATLRFARLMVGSGGLDLVAEGTNFNYARDPNPLPHVHNVKGSATVNLVSGSATSDSRLTKKVIHGVLMVAAWICMVPAGALLKRYGKPVFGMGINQFYGHVGLLMAAVIVSSAGIIYAKSESLGDGYKGHGTYMALTIIIGMALNPVIGILMYIFARSPTDPGRWAFSWSHKFVGYFLVIFTIIQCLFGVQSLVDSESDASRAPWYVAIFLIIGIFCGVAVYCEWVISKNAKNSDKYQEIQH